jgi:hypothetical protein
MVIGFSWLGWVTGGTAESVAQQRAERAVIAVLSPICADNFERSATAQTQRIELKKIDVWKQAEFIEKAGWAKLPGPQSDDREVARACAALIVAVN